MTLPASLCGFLAALPKTETHLHIEGALPWHLIHELHPERFPEPPQSWRDDYKFPSFDVFEAELLEMAGAWYSSPDRYHVAACEILRVLRHEHNVRYLETSFASGVIEYFQLDGARVAEAIKSAAPPDMEVRCFMGIHHNGYTDRARAFIDRCIDWPHLDGVDLHGTETFPLEPWTAGVWERFRAAGKMTKAHAGEFRGAEFVEQVIDELGVRRIQHGVRAVEDPRLLRRMRELGVACDVCPISNFKLDVVETLEEHPIRELMDSGIIVTVSTDDPVSFGNTLTMEYAVLHTHLGFDLPRLAQVAANGFRVADVSEAFRQAMLADIETLVHRFSP